MSNRWGLIGCILIITGTAVGAGMLALPLASAKVSFTWSVIGLFAIWFVTLISALLMLEVTLAFKAPHNNYHTMSFKTLGRKGEVVSWISLLCLLYALCAAYVTGGASILSKILSTYLEIDLPNWFTAVTFTIVIGGLVFWGTKIVDWVNRGLMLAKFVAFIVAMTLLLPTVNYDQLNVEAHSVHYLWAAFPIFLTSFGFHPVIPSLAGYHNNNAPLLRKAIIYGSIIPLVLYIIWQFAVKGVLPLEGEISFENVATQGGSVGELMGAVAILINDRTIGFIINLFSHIALATSFLGVSLALFDFLEDVVEKEGSTRSRRKMVALLTFVPPLLFAIFYPRGFILALGYAAIFVAFTCVIQPALMALQLRRSTELRSAYTVSGGNLSIVFVVLSGVVIVVLELLNRFGLLPH
jgi:tyrosine-specific transport protein